MRSPVRIKHEFVEFIPKEREDGVLYISIPYATAVHNCFCGCGLKVVTPISPVGWQLTFDGETVMLWPSVGNWSFPCHSHYVIRHDTVFWAGNMSRDEIERGRDRDRDARNRHYGTQTITPVKARKTSRTQGVEDLVRAVLANISIPYGEHVIEDVCLAIEYNQSWFNAYGQLRNALGRDVVNNWIGQYTKRLTGLNTDRQVSATRSKIIGSYTRLIPP